MRRSLNIVSSTWVQINQKHTNYLREFAAKKFLPKNSLTVQGALKQPCCRKWARWAVQLLIRTHSLMPTRDMANANNKAERISLSEIQNYERPTSNEFLLQRTELGSTLRDFTPPIVEDLPSWLSGVLDWPQTSGDWASPNSPFSHWKCLYGYSVLVSPLHIVCGSRGR